MLISSALLFFVENTGLACVINSTFMVCCPVREMKCYNLELMRDKKNITI